MLQRVSASSYALVKSGPELSVLKVSRVELPVLLGVLLPLPQPLGLFVGRDVEEEFDDGDAAVGRAGVRSC